MRVSADPGAPGGGGCRAGWLVWSPHPGNKGSVAPETAPRKLSFCPVLVTSASSRGCSGGCECSRKMSGYGLVVFPGREKSWLQFKKQHLGSKSLIASDMQKQTCLVSLPPRVSASCGGQSRRQPGRPAGAWSPAAKGSAGPRRVLGPAWDRPASRPRHRERMWERVWNWAYLSVCLCVLKAFPGQEVQNRTPVFEAAAWNSVDSCFSANELSGCFPHTLAVTQPCWRPWDVDGDAEAGGNGHRHRHSVPGALSPLLCACACACACACV